MCGVTAVLCESPVNLAAVSFNSMLNSTRHLGVASGCLPKNGSACSIQCRPNHS